MSLLYFAVMLVYVRLLRNFIEREFRNSLASGPTVRAFRRSTLLAVVFGMTGVGAEGFAVPVPFLLAILAWPLTRSYFLPGSLIGVAVTWALLLVVFLIREHYHDRFHARMRRKRAIHRPVVGPVVIIFCLATIAMTAPMFVSRQKTQDYLKVRRSLSPFVASVRRSVEQVWRNEGRLLCVGDEQLDSLTTVSDNDATIEARIEGCGRYVLSAHSRQGNEMGRVILKAETSETSSGIALAWTCTGATYISGKESYVVPCPSSPDALYRAARSVELAHIKASAYDFLAVDGDGWTGSLKKYDSNSRLIFETAVEASIRVLGPNELEISYSYPDQPHLNSRSQMELSQNGTMLAGADVIDRAYTEDGFLSLATIKVDDGNVGAQEVRRIYRISEMSFVERIITAGKDTEATRMEYTFTRPPDDSRWNFVPTD